MIGGDEIKNNMRAFYNIHYSSIFFISFENSKEFLRKKIKLYLYYFLHYLANLCIKSLYRLEVVGMENILKNRGALLIANHFSFIDFMLIGAIFPTDRFINFVCKHELMNSPIIKFLNQLSGVIIPISSKKKSPQIQEHAFLKINEKLKNDEYVVYFPEGVVSYDGKLNKFKWGFERIKLNNPDTLIQPICIKGLEGGFFSRAGGLFKMSKLRYEFRRKVTVTIAHPVPSFRWEMNHFESKLTNMLYKKNFDCKSLPRIRKEKRKDQKKIQKGCIVLNNLKDKQKKEFYLLNTSQNGFGILMDKKLKTNKIHKFIFPDTAKTVNGKIKWTLQINKSHHHIGVEII